MKNKYLLPYAACLGALATLVIPVAFLFWAVSTWDGLNPDGTPDNDPIRAAGMLLFFSPVFFGAIFLGMLLVSYILHSRKLIKKRVVSQLVFIFSFMPAIFSAYNDYNQYGIAYALKLFLGTLIFFLVSLSLGATVWWKVYHKGLKAHVTKPGHFIEQ